MMNERRYGMIIAAALAFATLAPPACAAAAAAAPAAAATPAQEAERSREAARDRAMAFERTLWAVAPGKGAQFTQKSSAEQRPLVEAHFKTLTAPLDKIEFLHVGDSRY